MIHFKVANNTATLFFRKFYSVLNEETQKLRKDNKKMDKTFSVLIYKDLMKEVSKVNDIAEKHNCIKCEVQYDTNDRTIISERYVVKYYFTTETDMFRFREALE